MCGCADFFVIILPPYLVVVHAAVLPHEPEVSIEVTEVFVSSAPYLSTSEANEAARGRRWRRKEEERGGAGVSHTFKYVQHSSVKFSSMRRFSVCHSSMRVSYSSVCCVCMSFSGASYSSVCVCVCVCHVFPTYTLEYNTPTYTKNEPLDND